MTKNARFRAIAFVAAAASAAPCLAAPPAPLPVSPPLPAPLSQAQRDVFRPIRAADSLRIDRGQTSTFTINFINFPSQYTAMLPAIEANLQAACREWSLVMVGAGNITIDVSYGPISNSRSATSAFVTNHGTYDEFMQGWPYKQQTGDDANLAAADIEITLDSFWLDTNVWLDPAPTLRQAPVPADRVDAVSLFMTMLGYCAFMNGWFNANTGELPATYRSSFDQDVLWSPTLPVSTGQNTRAAYQNADLPLTIGRVYGIGNNFSQPGYDLRNELMYGAFIFQGVRYEISPLTVAMMSDAAVTTRPVCRADINRDGSVSVQDIFDFLTAWFTSAPRADINADLLFTPQDIFNYISAWFTGCA